MEPPVLRSQILRLLPGWDFQDFRRALFAKEKEIFSLFGQDFQKRKDEEIEEILKKNPYNDI